MPHFERHHLLLAVDVELVARTDRIRRLLVVVEHELPADCADLRGMRDAQAPPRDIDFVNSLVAEIAVPRVPEPVPVVLVPVLGVLTHRRGSEEVVPIDAGGRLVQLRRVSYRLAPLVADALRHVDLADLALAQQFDRTLLERHAPTLRADLDHAVVLSRGLHHLETFVDVVARGLFDINVLARLNGPDCREGMPVVRSCDGHGVDVLVRENLPHVGIFFGLLTGGFLCERRPAFEGCLVDIAKAGETRPRRCRPVSDVGASAAAHADDGHVGPVIRAQDARGMTGNGE